MKLIAGLGNYGKEYNHSRHNAGFMVVDGYLARDHKDVKFKKKLESDYVSLTIFHENVIFLKPRTYMNLSGSSIYQYTRYFAVDHENLLVIHDDCDFEVGVVRVKFGGGSAGHNGVQSIIDNLKTDSFVRLRVGIGRNRSDNLRSYVLDNFVKSEHEAFKDVIEKSTEAINVFIKDGYIKAMNKINKTERKIEEKI